MLTNTPLEDAVMDRIGGDPRIPGAAEIAVTADGGIVTLRGTVETFSQRRAAADDANKLEGVDEVDDQLKVDLRVSDRRDDDEIRGVALRALTTELAWAATNAHAEHPKARDNRPDARRHGGGRSNRLVSGASPGRGQPKADGQTDRADHHQDHSDGGDVDPTDCRRDGEFEDRPEGDREQAQCKGHGTK